MGSEVWLTEGRGALLQEGLSKGCGQKLDQELAGFQFLGELMSEPAGPRMWGGTHGWECLARVWELGTCQNNVNLDVTEYGVRTDPCERGVPMAWHLEAGHPVPVPEIVTSTGPNRKRAARHRRQKTYSTAQLGSIFARLP